MADFSGDLNGGPVLGAGDFDGNGTLDLLGLERTPPAALIWSNRGDGTLHLDTTFGLNASGYVLAVGDFDRDGLSDFAIGFANSSGTVDVYENRGGGKFELASQITLHQGGAFKLAVADLDGDGAPDIVISGGTEEIEVARNRGDGAFPTVVDYGTRFLSETFAVGDVNRDGAPDVVAASAPYEVPAVGVFTNLGDGTLGPPTIYDAISYATGPIGLGDFDGDGWLDVARTCWQGSNQIAVRLNDGDGTLGSETGYDAGPWPWAIAVGRFLTTDGPLDIAIAPTLGHDYGGTGVSVFPGRGDGTFAEPVGANSPVTNVLVPGDFDGDGHPDLAFAAAHALGVLFFVCE